MRYDFNIIVNADAPSVSREGFATILLADTTAELDFQVLYNLDDYKGEEESAAYDSLKAIFSQKPAPAKVLIKGIADGSIEDIVKATRKETDDFFFITSTVVPESLEDDIEFIETLEKVYLGAVKDVETLESLAEVGYENTSIIYDNIAAANGLSVVMSFNPGGRTAHAKPLVAITPSKLDNEVYEKVKAANGNLYVRHNHKNRIVGGKALNGQWLDVVIGKYWIKFTLEQRLDDLITKVDKIPYNNRGVGMIAGVVSTVMSEAMERGIIDDFILDTKDVNEISASEKSTRIYDYLTVTGHLQGAIHGGDVRINLVYKEAEIDE